MKASIIIATYNRGEVLADTIAMALAQDFDDYEVIVVDQSSPLSVDPAAYAQYGDRIRFLTLSRPSMPGARNAGVLAARGGIVIFIDDDVVFGPEFVASHVSRYDDSSIGGVTGLTCPARLSTDEEILAETRTLYSLATIPADGLATVEWLVGCNCSFRRSLVLEAGLYDGRFKSLCDDSDMSVRVRQLGYRLLLDTGFRLVHLELQSGGARNRDPRWNEREMDQMQSCLYFFVKHRRFMGLPHVAEKTWQIYRKHALNRGILSRGTRAVLSRQLAFLSAVVQAFRWSATPARPASAEAAVDLQPRHDAPLNAA